MKRRTEISNRDKYITKKIEDTVDSNFYKRWYAKFGKPETKTYSGDEFMKRLQEMIDFE